jgi:predicted ArsR family transcriptional regulator
MFGLTPEQTQVIHKQKRAGVALQIMELCATRIGATADECIAKLGLPHQTVSARFSELVHCGCLRATNRRVKTRMGSLAMAYTVPAGTLFATYLTADHRSRKKWAGYSPLDQEVLTVAHDFMRQWRRTTNRAKREDLAYKLINDLGGRLAPQFEQSHRGERK